MRQICLILLFGGAAIAAAPFSHRVHLGMGLECVACHTAAAKSTRADDNLLPAKQVCLDCHDASELPSPFPTPPKTNLTKFSHQLHLKMGDVAPFLIAAIDHKIYLRTPGDRTDWIRPHLATKNPCQACHRGLAESDQVTPAAMPQMADCLVCHAQIEAPFSCWDCHSDKVDLRPASHTAIPHFMDAHTTGKLNLDKATCALCHGTNFHCMGCH